MSQSSETSETEPLINIIPIGRLQDDEEVPQKRIKLENSAGNSNSSPGLNLKVVRNPTNGNQTSKRKPISQKTPQLTPAKIDKTPRKKSLKSKTGEPQGGDIRNFFQLFVKTESNDTSRNLKIENGLPDRSPEPVDQNLNTESSEMAIVNQDEEPVAEADTLISNAYQYRPTKMEYSQSDLIITSVSGAIPASASAPPLSEKDSDESQLPQAPNSGISNQFQQSHSTELAGKEPSIENWLTPPQSPSPAHILQRKISVTQIDEISSTQTRNRMNSISSCSSSSSESSMKQEKKCKTSVLFGSNSRGGKALSLNSLLQCSLENIDKDQIPNADELERIIAECLLKLERLSLSSQSLSASFFEKYFKLKSNPGASVLLESFQLVHKNRLTGQKQNCYWAVISRIFHEVRTEAASRLAKRCTLAFLQQFFSDAKSGYDKYLSKAVKLNLPVIAKIFQGPNPDRKSFANITSNFKDLLKHTFQLLDFQNEFSMCTDWIDLMSTHYYKYNNADDETTRLVSAFVDVVKDTNQKDYGLVLLARLKNTVFVYEIIREIIEREFNELKLHPKETQIEFLLDIAKSRLVTVHDVHENCILKKANAKSKNSTEDSQSSKDSWIPTLTRKGETRMHIACGTSKNVSFKELEARITRMAQERIGDINVLDNAFNTPLHEAVVHNRSDVLHLLWNKLYSPTDEPGPLNVNIFAKNQDGNSPLHSAVGKGHKVCVSILVKMCSGDKEKLQRMLLSTNKAGMTPIDIAPDDIKGYLEECLPAEEDVFTFSAIVLQQESINNFKSNVSLQKLVSYWRYLHNKIAGL